MKRTIGLGEKGIVSAKKRLAADGVIETKMAGIPAKEWYRINFENLIAILYTPPDFNEVGERQDPPKEGGLSTPERGGLTIYNNNKYKENPPPSKKWSDLIGEGFPKGQVQFVRWFLTKQQKNFPKLIKGDITPTHPRVRPSLDALSKLVRLDGFDFETDIRPVLAQVPNDEFWARNLLSLASLRNKGKNGEIKFVNIQNTLRTKPAKEPPAKKPDSMQVLFSYGKQAHVSEKECVKLFHRAKEVLGNTPNASNETWLAENLGHLLKDIHDAQFALRERKKQNGTVAELVPAPLGAVQEYISWLEAQDWLTHIGPGVFQFHNNLFRQWINEAQQAVGYDYLTGADLW